MEMDDFIKEHMNSPIESLLFKADKYKDIDVKYAVEQIMSRRAIKEKLPSWFENYALRFPSKISTEQASSEITALYKQQLVVGDSLVDLTGGLGIDCYYMSQKTKKATYIERFAEYANCAKHNFQILGAKHIQVISHDSVSVLPTIDASTIYIDPARRATNNKRIFAVNECEPNVVEMIDMMVEKAQRVIIKLSPMIDITDTIKQLRYVGEIHVLSVKNECKELLFICEKKWLNHEVKVTTYNHQGEQDQLFTFDLNQENSTHCQYSTFPISYLYEPNSSILKSGAFKVVAQQMACSKMAQHSHLYTSDQPLAHFPGRQFSVIEIIENSKKGYKQLKAQYPKANLTTRNFPLSVADIRKKVGLKEGGDIYLFATTDATDRKIFIVCKKIETI